MKWSSGVFADQKVYLFPAGLFIITGLSDRCTIGGSIDDEGTYYFIIIIIVTKAIVLHLRKRACSILLICNNYLQLSSF